MSQCETGYLCDVCGLDVEEITDSDLYLRYVLGEVSPEDLNISRERHIRCNPTLAQFIVDATFEPVRCDGAFCKDHLDPQYVIEEEGRVTRGWRRLQELPTLGVPITEYPLPDVIEARERAISREEDCRKETNRTEYAQRMRDYLEGVAEIERRKG
jgi:hypothetical protein